ncbi:hypothetical protein FHX44_112046 [Pseudonocardia hierapolitana]|uniref:Uncharacterized protein n=1 Tax=Pseudonocardia hierapolitana TaxID=1128676 RepID=A0A561SMS0_9PSEU|nr:hypothetical protein FHX44_112046 [Pseudonocardia hierapolitana]
MVGERRVARAGNGAPTGTRPDQADPAASIEEMPALRPGG